MVFSEFLYLLYQKILQMSTINFAQKLAYIFMQDHESIWSIVQLAIPEFGAGSGMLIDQRFSHCPQERDNVYQG
jgi:hypothetical protein